MDRLNCNEGWNYVCISARNYYRTFRVLPDLRPLRKDRPLGTRGIIVAKVHALLEARNEVHEASTTLTTKRLPDGLWARLSPLSQMLLVRAIHSGRQTDAAIIDLIHRVRTMPLEEWEAYLVQMPAEARAA